MRVMKAPVKWYAMAVRTCNCHRGLARSGSPFQASTGPTIGCNKLSASEATGPRATVMFGTPATSSWNARATSSEVRRHSLSIYRAAAGLVAFRKAACGANSAVCAGVFSPAGAQKKYASAPTANAATIPIPAIRFRGGPKLVSVSARSFPAGCKRYSSQKHPAGKKYREQRPLQLAPGMALAQSSGGWSRLLSANVFPLNRAAVIPVSMLPPIRDQQYPIPAEKEDTAPEPVKHWPKAWL